MNTESQRSPTRDNRTIKSRYVSPSLQKMNKKLPTVPVKITGEQRVATVSVKTTGEWNKTQNGFEYPTPCKTQNGLEYRMPNKTQKWKNKQEHWKSFAKAQARTIQVDSNAPLICQHESRNDVVSSTSEMIVIWQWKPTETNQILHKSKMNTLDSLNEISAWITSRHKSKVR